jgi:hypothetical protein
MYRGNEILCHQATDDPPFAVTKTFAWAHLKFHLRNLCSTNSCTLFAGGTLSLLKVKDSGFLEEAPYNSIV